MPAASNIYLDSHAVHAGQRGEHTACADDPPQIRLPPHHCGTGLSVITSIAPARHDNSSGPAAERPQLCSSVSSVTLSSALASTPVSCSSAPAASARTSDALPRNDRSWMLQQTRHTFHARRALAPAALRIEARRLPKLAWQSYGAQHGLLCPDSAILITSACVRAISSTSRSSCAIMAVPPAARMIFAQSLMVTLLVMECTIGVRFCVFSRTALIVSINA